MAISHPIPVPVWSHVHTLSVLRTRRTSRSQVLPVGSRPGPQSRGTWQPPEAPSPGTWGHTTPQQCLRDRTCELHLPPRPGGGKRVSSRAGEGGRRAGGAPEAGRVQLSRPGRRCHASLRAWGPSEKGNQNCGDTGLKRSVLGFSEGPLGRGNGHRVSRKDWFSVSSLHRPLSK